MAVRLKVGENVTVGGRAEGSVRDPPLVATKPIPSSTIVGLEHSAELTTTALSV